MDPLESLLSFVKQLFQFLAFQHGNQIFSLVTFEMSNPDAYPTKIENSDET